MDPSRAPPSPRPPLAPHIYEGTFISAPTRASLDVLPHARIGVLPTGRIAFIHTAPPFPPLPASFSAALVNHTTETTSQFFFPGFVDTHTHPPQHPNIGLLTPSLLTWLTTYTYPTESSLGLPQNLPPAHRIFSHHIRRSLSHGTTTAAYYATTSTAATNLLSTLCFALGQRALVGRVAMDRASQTPETYRDASVASAVADTEATIEHIRRLDPEGERVLPVITPRFAPSCTAELLSALGALAEKEEVRVQTHLAESKAEVALVGELFPEAESYTGVYDTLGILREGTVLAHCVHLDDGEVELIRNSKAGVSHCPTSNMALGSGVARVKRMMGRGVKLGLGTDVSGGWAVGMLEVGRVAVGCSALLEGDGEGEEGERLTEAEVLYLATRGGAEVLGLESKGVGGWMVGGVWDAQLVELGRAVGDREEEDDGGNVDLWGTESWEEKVGKWVWGGDERNTVSVWVGGRKVWRRREGRG